MAHSITVKVNPTDQRPIYEEQFNTSGELFRNYFLYYWSRDNINPLCAYVIPIRTGNLKDFYEDLFFPSRLIAQAYEIKGLSKQIFLTLGFILDCATLLIRVITALPRYLENKSCRECSLNLRQYLIEQDISEETLKVDRVYVTVQWLQRGDTLDPRGNYLLGNYLGSAVRPISFIEQLPVPEDSSFGISHTATGIE